MKSSSSPPQLPKRESADSVVEESVIIPSINVGQRSARAALHTRSCSTGQTRRSPLRPDNQPPRRAGMSVSGESDLGHQNR